MQTEECWVKFEEKRRKLTRLFFLVLCFNVVLHLDAVEEVVDGPSSPANTFVKAKQECSSIKTVRASHNPSELTTHLFFVFGTITQHDLSKFGFYDQKKTQCLVSVRSKYKILTLFKMKKANFFHFSGLSPPQFA